MTIPLQNDSLESIVAQFSARSLPPVSQWRPEKQRDIDMRIDGAGVWFYYGSAIKRARMVALFSTILRREGDDYFLVTPVEKLRITVVDAPFIAQLMEVSGVGREQTLHFTDNAGNQFVAGAGNPLWVEHRKDQSRPYVMVRDNLPALMSRAVYYQLAELIVDTDDGQGVFSGGEFFPLT